MGKAEPRVQSPLRSRDQPSSPAQVNQMPWVTASGSSLGLWSRKGDSSQRRQALANKRQREQKCFWPQPVRRQPQTNAHLASRRWSLGRIRQSWHLRPRLAGTLHNWVYRKGVAS